MKVFFIIGAILMGTLDAQSVLQKQVPLIDKQKSVKKQTTEYYANPNFKLCECNRNVGDCNPYCCCDPDCPAEFKTQWNKTELCTDVLYDKDVRILQQTNKCFDSDQNEYEFNKNRGLETYYSPFMNLFCIHFNRAPEIGYYFNANKTVPTEPELKFFQDKPFANGIKAVAFDDEPKKFGSDYYQVGEKMKSWVVNGEKLRHQYDDGFPFPRPDSFGVCNNFGSAFFMNDDESQCMQMATIGDNKKNPKASSDQCDTLLNGEYYSKLLQVYTGQSGSVTNAKKLDAVGIKVYEYSNVDNSYTLQGDATKLKSKLNTAGSKCDCENSVKEVYYDIILEKDNGAELKTKYSLGPGSKFEATIVINKEKVQGTCGQKVGVSQKWKINFFTGGTKNVQSRSGNPGYMTGYPLKLGLFNPSSNQAVTAYNEGQQITGADQTGHCYKPLTSVANKFIDYNDPVIKFNTDLTYGCALGFTYENMKKLCQASDAQTQVQSLEIFKNINKMSHFGKFGNADIFFKKDWIAIKEDASFKNLGKTQWDEASQTCKIYNSVLLKVVYHQMAYNDHPQRYVIEVKKFAMEENWVYPSDQIVPEKLKVDSGAPNDVKSIDFDFFINVQYMDYEFKGEDSEGFVQPAATNFDSMMFYPTFLRSMSGGVSLKNSIHAIALCLFVIIYSF